MTFKKLGFTIVEVIFALSLFGVLVGGLLAFLPWGVDGVSKIKDRNTAISLVDAVQIELERLGFAVVEAGTHRIKGMYEFASMPKDESFLNQLVLVGKRTGGGVSLEKVIQRNQSVGNDGKIVIDDGKPEPLGNFHKIDAGVTIYFDFNEDSPISLKGMEIIESAGTQTYSMNRWIEPRDRYFAVVCSQYPADSRHAHHLSNGYLALECEVQWPYKLFDPSNQDPSDHLEANVREIEEKYRSKFTFPIAISR